MIRLLHLKRKRRRFKKLLMKNLKKRMIRLLLWKKRKRKFKSLLMKSIIP